MATRYDSFSVFMAEVTENTKNRILTHATIWGYIYTVLVKGGWLVFLSMCALLGLGPLAFGVAVVTASTTPFGLILGLVCVGGSGAALWQMYRKRDLPLAVKEIGQTYKGRYENAGSKREIDQLFNQACDELFNKVTNRH